MPVYMKGKVAAAAVAVGAAAVAATTLAAPAYAATPQTFITLSNPGLCLDAAAPNGDVGPGANVTAWPCNGGFNTGSFNQLWTIFGDGTIRNFGNSTLCLDAAAHNGDVGPGANVTAWPCNGGSNQKWIIYGDGTIQNVSNRSLCLDADAHNGDVGPGANVTAWPCNGGSNQKWV